jgi:hypothetical protein
MNFMNTPRGTALVAAVVVIALAACNPHPDGVRQAAKADPSAIVIGTAPAPPSGDPPGTTAVDPGTTDVSNAQKQVAMPLPGQANDHSTLAGAPSQRAGTSQANSSQEAAAASADGSSKKGQ